MEYQKLNLQEKAKYLFKKFKVEFDKWDCSSDTSKETCIYNRLTLLKLKFLPQNERVAAIYSRLCDEYSNSIID